MNKGNGVYEITPLEGIVLTTDDLNKPVLWLDVDNNGWLDYSINGRFFMNYGTGKFVYSPVFSLHFVTIKSGVTAVDMNNDGFVDILQAVEIDYNRESSSRYSSFLLKNQANSNNWLTLKPLVVTRSATPPISIETSPVLANKTYAFPIILGDAANMVDAVYGLGFSIRYDADKIVPNSVYLTYDKSWLGKNLLTISRDFNTSGRIDAALVRKNKLNIEGRGQIATLHFTTKRGTTNGQSQMAFTIQNSKAIDNANKQLILTEKTSFSTLTPTKEAEWESKIVVYPNPVEDIVHISSNGVVINRIEILDYRGVRQVGIPMHNFAYSIDMKTFDNSFYIVKISTENGVMLRKIIKMK